MKRKYVLDYGADTVEDPVIWKLVKDYDLKVNIIRAAISPGQEGNLLVEIDTEDEDKFKDALSWLESVKVNCAPVSKRIRWDEDRCINCGSCSGVCSSGAISMDRTTWNLQVDLDKCVACGLCVRTCPLSCFELHFGE